LFGVTASQLCAMIDGNAACDSVTQSVRLDLTDQAYQAVKDGGMDFRRGKTYKNRQGKSPIVHSAMSTNIQVHAAIDATTTST
jgi:hypothetical protein